MKQDLQNLVKEGLASTVKRDTEPEGRAGVVIYHLKGEDGSGLHDYLVKECIRLLEEKGLPILHVAKSGEDSLPDIELGKRQDPMVAVTNAASGIGIGVSPGGFNMEVETGLKKDVTDLLKRIGVSGKPTVVVTSSTRVADRDAKMMYAESTLAHRTSVTTFAEFRGSAERYKPNDR